MDPRVMARLWAKVDRTGDCWNWTGARSGQGYGRFKVAGRLVLPHRLTFEERFGTIPAGVCVLHRCDNPRCVRPDHLFLGTKSDNMRDCAAKGRLFPGVPPPPESFRGERHHSAKLTEAQVLAIRARHSAGATARGLAREFGVRPETVREIVYDRTWRHLLAPGPGGSLPPPRFGKHWREMRSAGV